MSDLVHFAVEATALITIEPGKEPLIELDTETVVGEFFEVGEDIDDDILKQAIKEQEPDKSGHWHIYVEGTLEYTRGGAPFDPPETDVDTNITYTAIDFMAGFEVIQR